MNDQERQTLDEISLKDRERLTLEFIVEFTAKDELGRPPTHKQLLAHLNSVLPKRRDGKPPLASTMQTLRIAYSLRRKGLLKPQTAATKGVHNNMVISELGKAWLALHGNH